MNRILGVVSWYSNDILHQEITRCTFKTPHWKPDRQAFYSDTSATFSASERFITPQCSLTSVPYVDSKSHMVITADVYLTNHAELCHYLGLEKETADIKLILEAYLKWGAACTQYLAGSFCFAIWSVEKRVLFAATDQFGSRPFYYFWSNNQFIFANEMSVFRQLLKSLTVNVNQFKGFALDTFDASETCYSEIKKILPGHSLLLQLNSLKISTYWSLKDQKKDSCYRKREEYYEAFKSVFEKSIQNAMRTSYPISSHVSGGLDSSAVTCQAAHFLSQKNQTLYAMTAVPKQLNGPSYRKGWYYHEMPLVDAILKQYQNIQHVQYSPEMNVAIFQQVEQLYSMLDQPIRNVFNLDWIMASLTYAQQRDGRIVLIGQHGNGSLSWVGLSLKNKLSAVYHHLLHQFNLDAFSNYHQWVNPSLLDSSFAKIRIKNRLAYLNRRYKMLSGFYSSPLLSSMHALSLWKGVEFIDPTRDLSLIQFCYQLPEWVYHKGNATLQKRLLVREGLKGLIPNAILENPYRGEQGADWFSCFNHSGQQWKERFIGLSSQVQQILWQCYDKTTLMNLWQELPQPIQCVNESIMLKYGLVLPRVLSAGFFLEYLLA